jgi:hypothetical protein
MHTLIALTLIAATSSSLATASPAGAEVRRIVVRPPAVELDSLRVAESLRRASAFAAAGRMGDARREYRMLITAERREGNYPAQALWMLANAYFAEDKIFETARTLDQLAFEAQEIIDPPTELRARLEAAVLWAKLREPTRARAGYLRVKQLLKSPAISAEQREWAKKRIGE